MYKPSILYETETEPEGTFGENEKKKSLSEDAFEKLQLLGGKRTRETAQDHNVVEGGGGKSQMMVILSRE